MAHFKAPAHPVYRNGYAPLFHHFLGLSEKDRVDELMKGVTESLREHVDEIDNPRFYVYRGYTEVLQKIEVIDSGHQLIKVVSDQWDETLSAKTIGKLKAEDIHLPFPAFAIDLSNVSWAAGFDVAFVSHFADQLVIRLEDNKDNWFIILLAHHITIEQTIAEAKQTEQSEDIAYKILSIVMYCTAFKREKNRVDIRSVKARNTQGFSKYRTSEVRLIQPEYAIMGKAGGKRGEHKGAYIVRGHWRAQAIGPRDQKQTKPIFINAFWKGGSKEELERVYKI